MPELLEATIKVVSIEPKTFDAKDGRKVPYWEITDGNDGKWDLWKKELADAVQVGQSFPIKYSTKGDKGQFKRIEELVGIQVKSKERTWGKPLRPVEEEIKIQRIISGGGIAKSLIENGFADPIVGIPVFNAWMKALVGEIKVEDIIMASPTLGAKAQSDTAKMSMGELTSKVYAYWQRIGIAGQQDKIKEWVGDLVPSFTSLGTLKSKEDLIALYNKVMEQKT